MAVATGWVLTIGAGAAVATAGFTVGGVALDVLGAPLVVPLILFSAEAEFFLLDRGGVFGTLGVELLLVPSSSTTFFVALCALTGGGDDATSGVPVATKAGDSSVMLTLDTNLA